LTLRDLNRTLLARQLLLERTRGPVPRTIERLCALQAQFSPSPYIALWTRLEGFRKEQLTRELERGTVIRATAVRGTVHLVSRRDYPFIAAAHLPKQKRRAEGRGVDVDLLRAALPPGPLGPEANELVGSDDAWTVNFAFRALPLVSIPPSGTWRYHRAGRVELWREPLPTVEDATALLVRRTLAAFGPMTRKDVEHFTYVPFRQLEPALERMRRIELDDGVFYDVPRGRYVDGSAPAPVRFLPTFDSIILAHHDRDRIIPPDYFDTVIRQKNATTIAPFLADGFVGGGWRLERATSKATLSVKPFAPLPRAVRRELVEEGERFIRWLEEDAPAHAVNVDKP
jgi:hypothetical protein